MSRRSRGKAWRGCAAPALKSLNLEGIPIDDSFVTALSQLKKLESLFIQRHKLTPEQLSALKTALPKCEIHN